MSPEPALFRACLIPVFMVSSILTGRGIIMEKILYFDYCTIPILIIVLFATLMRKMTKGLANRLFITIIILSCVNTVFDLGMELMTADSQNILLSVCSYGYYALRNGTVVLYALFIFAITRTWYRLQSTALKVALAAPYAVVLLLLFTNPFTGKIFTISEQNVCERGEWLIVFYVITAIYAVGELLYLIYCKKFLNFDKWVALMSLLILSFIAVMVQLIYPKILLEMFANSIALLLVALLVLRPEELLNSSVGLLSWKAYKMELKKIITTKQPVQIVVVRFINAYEILMYLGEDNYNSYMKSVADQINKLYKDIYFELYFEHPDNMYIVFDNYSDELEELTQKLYTMITDKIKEIDSSGIILEPRICLVRYPKDLERYEDIVVLGHKFFSLIPYEQTFARAADIILTRDFEIGSNMDMILNRALTRKSFEMYYQPIYSVKQKKFVSAEALIRLNDLEHGFISPAIFIPAAESKGLILPIGDFVLESVYRFISELDFEKLGLQYIEVNLSVAQCLQKDLPQKIQELEEKYHVTPDKINFEITETTYENIGDVIQENLKAITDRGYSFSLDDYGTGYSNIQRVSKLPLKIIKIDKTLVDDMGTEDGMSIMRNTVRMMKEIRKELVVEGVEHAEPLEELTAMNCDYIQGFYFSRPLPQQEFVKFIVEHNCA